MPRLPAVEISAMPKMKKEGKKEGINDCLCAKTQTHRWGFRDPGITENRKMVSPNLFHTNNIIHHSRWRRGPKRHTGLHVLRQQWDNLCSNISATFSNPNSKRHLLKQTPGGGTTFLSGFLFLQIQVTLISMLCLQKKPTHHLAQTSVTYYMRAKEGRGADFEWQYQCRAGNWELSILKESEASRQGCHQFLRSTKAAVSNGCKTTLSIWLPAFHFLRHQRCPLTCFSLNQHASLQRQIQPKRHKASEVFADMRH